MESKIDYGNGLHTTAASPYESSSQYLTSKYIRSSRAIGILWAVFSVCTAVLTAVVFASEHWIGDTETSKGPGHLGLWRFCTVLSPSDSSGGILSQEGQVICIGSLHNFASILSPAFRAATVFVGLSVLVLVLTIFAFFLFCFMKAKSVFEICGMMQFLSGICLAIGILSFPAGWDNDHVRSICGASEDYQLGTCGFRWAFVLAIIAFCDCWILGCLAFTLAHRVVKPQPENPYMYKGEINGGFIGDSQSLSGSRKSLTLQPVMMMPQPQSELGSPYGRAGTMPPPPPPMYGSPPPAQATMQNFQL